MLRTLTACLLLLALATNYAAGQPPVDDPRAVAETRRPAGRRLLDEVASERQRGRAALAPSEPELQPVAPNARPIESEIAETSPVAPATESADRAANYPFDAPLSAAAPTNSMRRSEAPAEAAPADRYAKANPAAPVTPPAVSNAVYVEEPAQVQTTAYAEPTEPVEIADQQQPAEPAVVAPPPGVPAELSSAVEAQAQPVEPALAGEALPLAPRDEVEAGAEAGSEAKPGFGDAKSPLTTMIGSLGLVLMIFFALVWVMRRAAPASLRQMPMDVVEVLGRAPLPGKQQQMHLVRCGRKLLLLASSPTGFTTLTEITDAHEVDRLASLCRGELPRVGAAAFQQSLNESAHDSFGRGYSEESIDSAATALARRLSRSSRLGGSDD